MTWIFQRHATCSAFGQTFMDEQAEFCHSYITIFFRVDINGRCDGAT